MFSRIIEKKTRKKNSEHEKKEQNLRTRNTCRLDTTTMYYYHN